MRINRAAIKNNAKMRILQTKPSPIAIGLVYILTAYTLSFLISILDGSYRLGLDAWLQYLSGNPYNASAILDPEPSARLLIIALTLMLTIIGAGFTMYCMRICQGEKAGYRNLLDGFTIFFKLIWLEILMGVFVFLWTLLFFIPGIIAAYRYRMALYILIDNPELGALECIRRSKQMMIGRKGELFVLDLSFLGWWLLAIFLPALIWVTPYTTVTYVNYYLALRDLS